MTKQKDNSNANTKPSADPRLKTVTALIETQLSPVKEVIADLAKAMLDNTSNLNNRIKSLSKFNATTTAEPNANEPQPPTNNHTFIPRSARIKLELNHSSTLANDTKLKGLKERLELCKQSFTQEITSIFKACAEIEVEHAKEQRTKTFLAHTHKITQALISFEKIDTILLTNLDESSFIIWTILYFLKEIDNVVPELGDPFFYQDYLQIDLQDTVKILLEDFPNNLADENSLERRIRNDNEKKFQNKVIKKLLEVILPVTIDLQTTIDREEKIKKTASIMSAQFKKNAITTATEATAIAIGNTSLNNQSMEQYLKKLVEDVIKTNNKQQKNSTGSKTPRLSLPKHTKKGLTTTKTPKHHQNKKTNKKRKPHPANDSASDSDSYSDDDDTNTTESQNSTPILRTPKKKIRFSPINKTTYRKRKSPLENNNDSDTETMETTETHSEKTTKHRYNQNKKTQPKKKHQTGRKKLHPEKNIQGPQEGRRKGGKSEKKYRGKN